MDRKADLVPVEVGLKTRETLAEPPWGRIWEEALSLKIEKLELSVPLIEIIPMLRLRVPVLFMVTTSIELEEPD